MGILTPAIVGAMSEHSPLKLTKDQIQVRWPSAQNIQVLQ